MTMPDELSRRILFAKMGALFTSAVGVLLAVPMVRYLLSPVAGSRAIGDGDWLPLGSLDRFPVGETRLATFRQPRGEAWDGVTAETACWVRRIDARTLQVFAINCAHLGCPVRWFPASGLFLCPCHGGAYYADGSRASGPPARGLFEYVHRTDAGTLFIKVGTMPTPGPTPGRSAALSTIMTRPPCV